MNEISPTLFDNVDKELQFFSEVIFNEWMVASGEAVMSVDSRSTNHNMPAGVLEYVTDATFKDGEGVRFSLELDSSGFVGVNCYLIDDGEMLRDPTLNSLKRLENYWQSALKLNSEDVSQESPDKAVKLYWKDPAGETSGFKEFNLENVFQDLLEQFELKEEDFEGDKTNFLDIKNCFLYEVEGGKNAIIESVCGTQGYLTEFYAPIDIKSNPHLCPCCGSDNIFAYIIECGDTTLDNMHCESCGEVWEKNTITLEVDIEHTNKDCMTYELAKATREHFKDNQPVSGQA